MSAGNPFRFKKYIPLGAEFTEEDQTVISATASNGVLPGGEEEGRRDGEVNKAIWNS